RLGAGGMGHPPVCRIAGVTVLDEMQLREFGPVEHILLPKTVIPSHLAHLGTSALHGLKNQKIARGVFAYEVQREQRMAQVIKHAKKENDVECLPDLTHVVYGEIAKFDIGIAHFRGKARLAKVIGILIYAEHARCTAALHFEGI